MIADRHEIRAVAKAGEGELHVTVGSAPPAIGSVQKLQSGVGRTARFQARVLDAWDHVAGGWVVVVEIVAEEILPRYLTRNGETTDPGKALRDPHTGQAEWMPPKDWVDDGKETRDRVREQYRREQESDTVTRLIGEVDTWDDLVRLKQLARARGVEISDDLRVIEARLERRVQKRKQGLDDSAETRVIEARVESIGRKLGKAA